MIAGATGFIGTFLTRKFQQLGYEVFSISRQPKHISWSDLGGIRTALENSEMIINLAGKSVNCRYTKKNKEEILSSRIKTTEVIGKAIQSCTNPPKLWLNSSTATIYRHAQDRPQTESLGEMGTGFSVDVARAWEQALFNFTLHTTRQVALRISIVLGKDGGVIPVYNRLVKLRLGGKQGPGNQMFSWIHIEDLYNAIVFIQNNSTIRGVVNCATPNPVNNTELMKSFRNACHVNVGLPAPKFLLKIGAALIGTETELILKSRWVLPEKLIQHGFTFEYPEIDGALKQILQK